MTSWPIRLQDSLKCNICKKNWRIKLIFSLQISMRVSFKLVLLLWWACLCVPKVSKITSLQYLCSISRKRWEINMIFCMKININVFYKLVISFLLVRAKYDLVPSHVKITQVNMQYLCDILRKKSGIKLGS